MKLLFSANRENRYIRNQQSIMTLILQDRRAVMIYKRKHQHVFKLLSILKDFFLAEKDMECTDADTEATMQQSGIVHAMGITECGINDRSKNMNNDK